MTSFTLPKWYDLHAHFRQDELLAPTLKAHADMGCAGILAMPNTKPPVGKVTKTDPLPYWSIEEYLEQINLAGGNVFDEIIIPLYLTKDTTVQMIEEGAKSGLLKACKYYPPHGTTGAEHSWHFQSFIDNGVFKALEDNGIVLCVHGEKHDLSKEDYFSRTTNAEESFYREDMPRVIEAFPNLKIVGEHLTTKVGVDLILQAGSNVTASVTPQHLIYTVGHLLHGLKFHLYCLPLVKFEEDREALRNAVTASDNTKFFAGTDSAPHTCKATDCGCAAGCFTGGIAPQLYATAFEMAGVDLDDTDGQKALERFLVNNGADFYNLPIPQETFTLERGEENLSALNTPQGSLTPLSMGMGETLEWKIKI